MNPHSTSATLVNSFLLSVSIFWLLGLKGSHSLKPAQSHHPAPTPPLTFAFQDSQYSSAPYLSASAAALLFKASGPWQEISLYTAALALLFYIKHQLSAPAILEPQSTVPLLEELAPSMMASERQEIQGPYREENFYDEVYDDPSGDENYDEMSRKVLDVEHELQRVKQAIWNMSREWQESQENIEEEKDLLAIHREFNLTSESEHKLKQQILEQDEKMSITQKRNFLEEMKARVRKLFTKREILRSRMERYKNIENYHKNLDFRRKLEGSWHTTEP